LRKLRRQTERSVTAHTVVYGVSNHRDSPTFAEIILLDEAE
jgi:hypothetical protein